MAIKLKPTTKYVYLSAQPSVIDGIRRSGVKVDPMAPRSETTLKVAEWVPPMVKMWTENQVDGTMFGDMTLEEFLRKMASQY